MCRFLFSRFLSCVRNYNSAAPCLSTSLGLGSASFFLFCPVQGRRQALGLILVDPPLCGGFGSRPSLILLLGRWLSLAFACRFGRDTAPVGAGNAGPPAVARGAGLPAAAPTAGLPASGAFAGRPAEGEPLIPFQEPGSATMQGF